MLGITSTRLRLCPMACPGLSHCPMVHANLGFSLSLHTPEALRAYAIANVAATSSGQAFAQRAPLTFRAWLSRCPRVSGRAGGEAQAGDLSVRRV